MPGCKSTWVAAAVSFLIITGCGGGSHDDSTHVRLDVHWAERAAVTALQVSAPSSALSVQITLSRSDTAAMTFTVDRPAGSGAITQTVVSPARFPTGPARLECVFFAQSGATGDIVGVAMADVTIEPNGGGAGIISTEGQVASVVVAPDQVVIVGEATDLAVSVRNQQAELVAVSPGSVFWTVTEGPDVLTFEQGHALAVARGEATVQATVDGIASAPVEVIARRMPSAFLLPKPDPTGRMYPLGMSHDGGVIVGMTTSAAGRDEAFRWTEETGTVLLGCLTGFEETSVAVATSADGSVLVGLSGGATAATAIVWTEAGGMQAIPMPPEALGSQAVDVTADGVYVYGVYAVDEGIGLRSQHFVWSESGGMRTISGSGIPAEWQAMGLSGDGYRFMMAIDMGSTTEEFQGARLNEYALQGAEGLRAGRQLTDIGASQVFWACEAAISYTGTAVAGYCTPRGGGWVVPAIWTETTGVLQIAPGTVGYTRSISPDGLFAGGGNGDRGTAFTWDPVDGYQNLTVAIERMDDQLGTDVQNAFATSGGPSYVYAISADNGRITGTAGDALFNFPCDGFVLDLP